MVLEQENQGILQTHYSCQRGVPKKYQMCNGVATVTRAKIELLTVDKSAKKTKTVNKKHKMRCDISVQW